MLPPHIPHSPQRPENTVGLVIERTRKEGELDHRRGDCESWREVLNDAAVQLEDLGTQLKPIIENFYADESLRTCKHCEAVMQPPQKPK